MKQSTAQQTNLLRNKIHEFANYTCIVRKNWSPSHGGTGSYSRQAGRLLGRQKCCKGNSVYLECLEQIFSTDKVVSVHVWPVFWQIPHIYNNAIYPGAFLWKPYISLSIPYLMMHAYYALYVHTYIHACMHLMHTYICTYTHTVCMYILFS